MRGKKRKKTETAVECPQGKNSGNRKRQYTVSHCAGHAVEEARVWTCRKAEQTLATWPVTISRAL